MSVNRLNFSPSLTRPTDTPATGWRIGTPASMRASVPPHTEAIEDDPFDSRISEINRIVYGNLVGDGRTAFNDRSASMPCPISRRPGPRIGFVSPTLNGGKL